jgi:hypothetical protein
MILQQRIVSRKTLKFRKIKARASLKMTALRVNNKFPNLLYRLRRSTNNPLAANKSMPIKINKQKE